MKKLSFIIIILFVSFLLIIKYFDFRNHHGRIENKDHNLPILFEGTFEQNAGAFSDFNENGLEQISF
ncbi:hypothetical protein IEE83_16985 [Dyadobacter sp. UP-52]|uniref:Uncharacterized protein n=1 Tax=Dyadobacter subterraneus TaxID=2773304 RepID=A0ABR9WDT4_9BACT|nr:hypothetical protein [Dyadobacter subterraneus]